MTNSEKLLWSLWERLELLRQMDSDGHIECYVCGQKVNYTQVSLRVVYNRTLPFSFVAENNYFCCDDCKRPGIYRNIWKKKNNELGYDLRQKIVLHQPVVYDEDEIQQAIRKLSRILKNHDYERQ